jgi:hypothetical protein
MEEEKKEEIVKVTECCDHKKFGHHFHGCCGHKVARAILLALAIFAIFSLGVCVGSHRNFDREIRYGRTFNFEQQGGGRMMRPNNFQGQQNNSGCRFQEQNNQDQFQGQVEVQSVPSATIQVVSPQVKTVTPAK